MSKTFLDLAKSRFSVRAYEKRPVETDKLTAILEAGHVAPTAGNQQPCIFLVLNKDDSIAKLGKACTPHGAPLAVIVCADAGVDTAIVLVCWWRNRGLALVGGYN